MTLIRLVLRSVLTAALLVALAFWVFPLMPQMLAGILAANSAWVDTAARPLRDGLTEELMDAAVRHGIIRVAADGERIEILDNASYKAALTAGTARPVGQPDPGTEPRLSAEAVLKILSRGSGAGPELRRILQRATIERTVLAVRDSGLSAPCTVEMEGGECPPSVWSFVPLAAASAAGDTAAGGTVREYGGEPEPRVFAALAERRDRVNGPWTMTTGTDSGGVRLAIVPDLPASTGAADRKVVIEVIGRDIRLPIWSEPDAVVTHYCLGRGSAQGPARATPCGPNADEADRVALHALLPAGMILADFRIEARPVGIPLLGPDLKATLAASGPETLVRFAVNDEVSIACLKGGCWPDLSDRRGQRRLARDHSLKAEDPAPTPASPAGTPEEAPGEPVATAIEGNPYIVSLGPDRFGLSDLALDLRMQPLLGIPKVASGSLIDFFVGLPPGVEAADFEMSFDPDLQRSVQAVLTGGVGPKGTGYVRQSLLSSRDDVRRAAFVLFDLSEGAERGAVRAAAIYPAFDPAVSDWNLRALAFGSLAYNPLAPPAWSGLDASLQPGSSMKILSALSLIHSAAGASHWVDAATGEGITKVLRGTDAATLRDLTGLDVNATGAALDDFWPGAGSQRIADRGNSPLQLAGRARGGCGRIGAAELGLCEAIAASSNMFFAAMSLFENRRLLDAYAEEPETDHDVLALGRLFQHFGIENSVSLVRLGADVGDARPPRAEAARLPSAPGLADRSRLAPPDLVDQAANAYGQNVFVTPVIMASVAGAIATGGWVDPFIARAADAAAPFAVPVVPETPLAQELLEILRSGMKAVVKPNGTGHSVFVGTGNGAAALAERVWAKTGTATIDDPAEGNAHWFVGWVTDANSKPRYAFACTISHVASGNYPCIRTTAQVLLRLQQEGRL